MLKCKSTPWVITSCLLESLYTVGGTVNWHSHYGKWYMESLQKIKTSATIWSTQSTSGNTSEGNENTVLKRQLYLHAHCSIIYNSNKWKASIIGWKCPSMDEMIKKVGCIYIHKHTHMEYYLAIKKWRNPAICNNMGGPLGDNAKWNRSERVR